MISRFLRVLFVFEVFGALAIAGWLAGGGDWNAYAALAAGAATPVALHAGIVALNFGISALEGSPTPSQHRIGPVRGFATYLAEVRDSLQVFQWAQPWLAGRALPGEDASAAARSTSPIPVVLVHGYLCNRQVWRPFARWLAARGHAVQGVDLEPVFGSIDGYADQVDRAVRRLLARTGGGSVAIVGHSMGGLATRAFLRAHPDAPVAAVVTLGTPHQGTAHARFGQGANARQMRPNSPWLRELAASESADRLRRFTVVLSHHDNIVAPQATQTLPGARTVEFAGIGHLSLAMHPRVWAVAGEALEQALPRDGNPAPG